MNFATPRSLVLAACSFVGIAGAFGCMAQRGFVPMAGSRYPSTLCVFGMRGVRATVDDCDYQMQQGSLDVTLTMGGNTAELRRRAHALIENAGYSESGGVSHSASFHRPAPLLTPAHSVVEDVAGGVKIHVTPNKPDDLEPLRDEIEARLERASDPSRCN